MTETTMDAAAAGDLTALFEEATARQQADTFEFNGRSHTIDFVA